MLNYESIVEEIKRVSQKSKMADHIANSFASDNLGRRSPCANNVLLQRFIPEELPYRNGRSNIQLLKPMSEIRKQKIDEKLENFIDSSTCHGFKHCFDKRHKVRRFIWIVIVTLSVVMLVDKLYESTIKYFERPFSTKTTKNYVDEMEFPAVSICNNNDFRISKMLNTTLHEAFRLKNESISEGISGKEYARTTQEAKHSLIDMLDICEFNGKGCDAGNFTEFYQTQGEKCFTINTKNEEAERVTGAGIQHSLKFTINIEQYDYYFDNTEAGIRVIIHDRRETPVLMHGLNIPPGFSGYIQIKTLKTINLKKPYATACSKVPLIYYDHYSANSCYLERLTNYVVKECFCKDGFMPGPTRVCSIKELKNCTWPSWERFKKIPDKNCPIPCEITDFESTLSFSQFPANKAADTKAANLNLTGSIQENRRFIRDNFLQVVIYFKHMSYIKMEQSPSYDLMVFLGDIGGQFGLFLGTSILTYIEFFDLLIMLAYTKYFEIFKPRKK